MMYTFQTWSLNKKLLSHRDQRLTPSNFNHKNKIFNTQMTLMCFQL